MARVATFTPAEIIQAFHDSVDGGGNGTNDEIRAALGGAKISNTTITKAVKAIRDQHRLGQLAAPLSSAAMPDDAKRAYDRVWNHLVKVLEHLQTADRQAYQKQIDLLEAEAEKLGAEVDYLNDQLEAAEQDIQTKAGELQVKDTTIQHLQGEVQRLTTERDDARQKLATEQSNHAATATALQAATTQAATLGTQLQIEQALRQQREQELQQARSDVTALEKDKIRLDGERQRAEDARDRAQDQAKDLQGRLDRETRDLRDQLADVRGELAKAQQVAADAERQRHDQLEARRTAEGAVQALTTQMDNMRRDFSAAIQQFNATIGQMGHLPADRLAEVLEQMSGTMNGLLQRLEQPDGAIGASRTRQPGVDRQAGAVGESQD